MHPFKIEKGDVMEGVRLIAGISIGDTQAMAEVWHAQLTKKEK